MMLMTLPASLSKSRKLHLDNTPELADAIAAKPSTKGAGLIVPKPVLKPIVELASGDHDVTPIELLHAIGRSTTPPTMQSAGMSAWWAVLRWLWAFEPTGTRMRISGDAKQLSFHSRQAFSEALGIAVSRVLTQRAYGAGSRFRFVDVDSVLAATAITDPKLAGSVAVGKIDGLLPDYIAFRVDKVGTMSQLRAVECKGNHSNRVKGFPGEVCKQLRDARVQGPSLMVGGSPLGDAWLFCASVATNNKPGDWGCGVVTSDEIRIFAVDPPGDHPADAPPERGRTLWQRVDRGWSLADPERLAHDARDLERAAILAWAGDVEGARAASPLTRDAPGEWPASTIGGRHSREDAVGGRLEGTELRIALPDGVALRLFFGADRDVLEAARSTDPTGLAEAVDAFGARRPDLQHPAGVVETVPENTLTRSLNRDGTVLEVELQGLDPNAVAEAASSI